MDSDSAAITLSSPTPPSPQEYSVPAGEETPDPEEYETASDPDVDDTNSSAVLSPEESVLKSSSATGDQKISSFDEGDIHGSSRSEILRENSDSSRNPKGVFLGVGEKVEEGEEREMISPVLQKQVGSNDSGGGDVARSKKNGVGESQAEKIEILAGENEHSSRFDAGASQYLEPMEPGDGDSSVAAIESNSSESGVVDSASPFNQYALDEVEPKFIDDVEGNDKPVNLNEVLLADSDVLKDNHVSAVVSDTLEVVEGEAYADGAENFESLVADDNDCKSTDAGRELDVAVEDEKKPIKPAEVGSIDEDGLEGSSGEVNVLKGEASEFNPIDSNCEVAGKGLVEIPETVNVCEISKSSIPIQEIVKEMVVVGSENVSSPGQAGATVQLTADDVDLKSSLEAEILPVIAKETVVGDDITQGTSTDCLPQMSNNLETAEEKVMVGSEDAPCSGEGEPAIQSIEVDGNLKSGVEVEILPISSKETVVGDGNTKETITENLPQKSNTDKLDGTSLNQQTPEDKVVVRSEYASSHGEGEPALQFIADDHDSNPAVEVENLPVTAAKETGARDESLPEIPELSQKVETDEEVKAEADSEDKRNSDDPTSVAILESPEAAKQIMGEIEKISSSSQSAGLQGSRDYSASLDGQIVSDSDEVLDSDEEGDGGELFDSAALAALLKAATSSSDGTVTVTAQDAARIFSGDRPVGLGASVPSLRPAAPRSTRPSLFTPSEILAVEEPDHSMDDDEKRLHEKVEQIRVKFLRLVHRLGHSPADAVAGQVLYRLSLAEGIKQGRQMSRTFNIENTKKQALLLEEKDKDGLDFSCNLLVLGKTGVGKSATINSIFGEEMSHTNPFQLATASVRVISGLVDGIRIRVIDTPGLKPSIMDQAANRKILASIKAFTKKCPPDIVLYVDRMDTQTRDFNDMPLLRSITSILGPSIWFNAIVALTHAASAPPDGPNGSPMGYEVFVTQRSHVVQQSIRQAAGDMRLMNPVALIENHPSCRRNREGERVLPNGLSWRPQLLLLSYASKILSEANSLLKLQESSGKLFAGFRHRSPPLPFLLSSLLQSRAHPKLSGDHVGDNADSDIDPDEFSDAEQDEEVDDYDQLPPFKPLKKSQISMLTKEQKKAYFDEYDYRVKLLQKKQWKDELRRLKENKKKGKVDPNEFTNGVMPEDYDQDGSPAAVPILLPDMVLPPSFDCDNPAFRYRFLEPTSQIMIRPVLDTHGWDHDCGYDGISIDESLAIASQFPTSMAVQITKDKKEFNIHLDSSVAVKHGEHGSTLAGFDIQSVGKQLAYILRGETKFNNLKKNKTAAGMSVTFLGETVATGLKLEDKISIGKCLGLVASTGAVLSQGDAAYGANLEVRLKDKDYPIGQALSTLGLSLMKWRSDLALGANLQSQFSVGRNSKMAVRVGLNNKHTGQITVRTSTSDQLQIAFTGIIPLAIFIFRSIKSNESYMNH